jgi:hypothetical protein
VSADTRHFRKRGRRATPSVPFRQWAHGVEGTRARARYLLPH